MTSPVVVLVMVEGNLPRCQKDSFPNRNEMTWETLESMSTGSAKSHRLVSLYQPLTSPHVILVPFETVRMPFLVIVRPSLLSITPGQVQPIEVYRRA